MPAHLEKLSQEIIDLYHLNEEDIVELESKLDVRVDFNYLRNAGSLSRELLQQFIVCGVDSLDLLAHYLQNRHNVDPLVTISKDYDSTHEVDRALNKFMSSVVDSDADSYYVDSSNPKDPLFIINGDENVRLSTVLKMTASVMMFNEVVAEAICRKEFGVGLYAGVDTAYEMSVISEMLTQIPGDHNRAIVTVNGIDHAENTVHADCRVIYDKKTNIIMWSQAFVLLLLENPGFLKMMSVAGRVLDNDDKVEVYDVEYGGVRKTAKKTLGSWIVFDGVFHGVDEEALGLCASTDHISDDLRIPEEGVEYLGTHTFTLTRDDSE